MSISFESICERAQITLHFTLEMDQLPHSMNAIIIVCFDLQTKHVPCTKSTEEDFQEK